jgi:hypothetical protein
VLGRKTRIIAITGEKGSQMAAASRQIDEVFHDSIFEPRYPHECATSRLLFNLIREKIKDKLYNRMFSELKRSIAYGLWHILVVYDLLVQMVYYASFKRKCTVLLNRYQYAQLPRFVRGLSIVALWKLIYDAKVKRSFDGRAFEIFSAYHSKTENNP